MSLNEADAAVGNNKSLVNLHSYMVSTALKRGGMVNFLSKREQLFPRGGEGLDVKESI